MILQTARKEAEVVSGKSRGNHIGLRQQYRVKRFECQSAPSRPSPVSDEEQARASGPDRRAGSSTTETSHSKKRNQGRNHAKTPKTHFSGPGAYIFLKSFNCSAISSHISLMTSIPGMQTKFTYMRGSSLNCVPLNPEMVFQSLPQEGLEHLSVICLQGPCKQLP